MDVSRCLHNSSQLAYLGTNSQHSIDATQMGSACQNSCTLCTNTNQVTSLGVRIPQARLTECVCVCTDIPISIMHEHYANRETESKAWLIVRVGQEASDATGVAEWDGEVIYLFKVTRIHGVLHTIHTALHGKGREGKKLSVLL